jgi:hypothetical protein
MPERATVGNSSMPVGQRSVLGTVAVLPACSRNRPALNVSGPEFPGELRADNLASSPKSTAGSLNSQDPLGRRLARWAELQIF